MMERSQTAWFYTASRFIIGARVRTGSGRITRESKRAPGLGFVWRRSRPWSPPIIGSICQQFPHGDPPHPSQFYSRPYGQFASCDSKSSFASQLGLFASNRHFPLRTWPRHPLRPLRPLPRCVFPSRPSPDSEKQAHSSVVIRKSLRPYRTIPIIALIALAVLKVTLPIVLTNLADSCAQDRTQRRGRSLTQRNSSSSRTQSPMTFLHPPTTTPGSPKLRLLPASQPWSGPIPRNLRNGAMAGELEGSRKGSEICWKGALLAARRDPLRDTTPLLVLLPGRAIANALPLSRTIHRAPSLAPPWSARWAKSHRSRNV